MELARDFKKKAAKKYGIKKLILFGSQTTGKTRKGSDIDMLVVSDNFKKRTDFMSKLFAEWHIVQKKDFPVDFLPYRTKEFERMRKGVTIVRQVMEEGVEI
ncbi:MAG: nucleotidyltransferase domain-containing protein [Patescibacteria group bacterium]|nr:nucleotidyltransferase domain-containing protein [Patescibacteria group bacterium]